MITPRKPRPLVGTLLKELAEEVGVQVFVERKHGYVGQISCPNGKIHYFRNTSFDLNPLGSSLVAKDKAYAALFMRKLGYPTIPGQTFYSTERCQRIGSVKDIDAAYRYACRLGFPVIVKPNSRSQGSNVSKANTKREFYQGARKALASDSVLLVQRFITGRDYRIVVLDGKVISAYERAPLTIMGDGHSTVEELLAEKQADFVKADRDTVLDSDDFRIRNRLTRAKLGLKSVLSKQQSFFLLDNANLSSGGDATDVTGSLHPRFKEIAIKLTQEMGLRYCGVDIMTERDLQQRTGKYWITEINSSPGLDHYALSGEVQPKTVKDFYRQILIAIKSL